MVVSAAEASAAMLWHHMFPLWSFVLVNACNSQHRGIQPLCVADVSLPGLHKHSISDTCAGDATGVLAV